VIGPQPEEVGAKVTTVPQGPPEVVAVKISEGQVKLHTEDARVIQPENSDVLFDGSVAVAVITLPLGTDTGRFTFIVAT
jgi:hypothetical protein